MIKLLLLYYLCIWTLVVEHFRYGEGPLMLIEVPKVHFHNTDELSRVPDRVSVDNSYQSGGYSYVGENRAPDLPLPRYWLCEVTILSCY
jgi:hypothetical protein